MEESQESIGGEPGCSAQKLLVRWTRLPSGLGRPSRSLSCWSWSSVCYENHGNAGPFSTQFDIAHMSVITEGNLGSGSHGSPCAP